MILKQVKFITASNNIKINNMKKKSSFKMKGNPMKRNFGIGDSPMRIGGLIKAFAKRFATKATKPKVFSKTSEKPIPNIKAVDIKTGKTVAPKDFDPTKAYRYKTAAEHAKRHTAVPPGRHEKITKKTKFSYHDYNKDVKGRIRQ